jgi:glyoxalase family protein
MQLEGVHHITAITGDAPRNVEFYVGTMGMRLVKKTVNQDDPTVYHLFYGDEQGSPGFDLTFFEYPGAAPGRPGDGMIHRIAWRVASEAALDFWERRLADEGYASVRGEGTLRFADPEGLEHELEVYAGDEAPLLPDAPDVPAEFALQGFAGARAYASDPAGGASLLRDALGFEDHGDGRWRVAGEERSSWWAYDEPPAERGIPGGGTVHHIAWASRMDDHLAWRERVLAAGGHATPVIDRFWFRSVYFREPSGVLFELATIGPGFAVDEPAETLGQRLTLPPDYEHYRPQLERALTPLPDPRAERARAAAR